MKKHTELIKIVPYIAIIIAAAAMSLSSLSVVGNSALLKRVKI